jgi:hypothetical protein
MAGPQKPQGNRQMPAPPAVVAPVSQVASLVADEAPVEMPAPSQPPAPAAEKVEAPVVNEAPKSEDPVIKEEGQGSNVILKPMPVGIEVVAIRPGFFKNRRMNVGEIFTVKSMEKVGAWMKCTDPELEKQHQALAKKKKENAAGK